MRKDLVTSVALYPRGSGGKQEEKPGRWGSAFFLEEEGRSQGSESGQSVGVMRRIHGHRGSGSWSGNH